MLPEERSAEQTITGLAAQIQDLNCEEPMAFERALELAMELRNAASLAIAARVRFEAVPAHHDIIAELDGIHCTGIITRDEIDSARRIA